MTRTWLLVGLLIVVSACSAPNENVGGGTVAVVDGRVAVSADDLEFDASVITAPAGEPFIIVLTNREDVPHNLSVYTREGGDPIVIGEFVASAGLVTEVAVPALDAGRYFFVCDIHPQTMTGMLVVGTQP